VRVVAYRQEERRWYCTLNDFAELKKERGKKKKKKIILSRFSECGARVFRSPRVHIRAVCGKSARVDRDAHLRVARACGRGDTERAIS